MTVTAIGEAPFCECGCGEQVKCHKHGVWSRWRPGHSGRGSAGTTAVEPVRSEHPPALSDRPTVDWQLSMWPDLAPAFDIAQTP